VAIREDQLDAFGRNFEKVRRVLFRVDRCYPAYTFTEQVFAVLSSVLRSKREVQVNVEIRRAIGF